jgi:hypothetical protein
LICGTINKQSILAPENSMDSFQSQTNGEATLLLIDGSINQVIAAANTVPGVVAPVQKRKERCDKGKQRPAKRPRDDAV